MAIDVGNILYLAAQLIAMMAITWYVTRDNKNAIKTLAANDSQMLQDIAVIKMQVLSAVSVAQKVDQDHDKLIRLEVLMERAGKDLNALHGRARDIESRMNTLEEN